MNINEFPQQVNQVISIAETILQGQILGIYLYGSATMNGLRPDSDIDKLVETMWEQFCNLGIYESNVIETTTYSIQEAVFAVKEKISSGAALLS